MTSLRRPQHRRRSLRQGCARRPRRQPKTCFSRERRAVRRAEQRPRIYAQALIPNLGAWRSRPRSSNHTYCETRNGRKQQQRALVGGSGGAPAGGADESTPRSPMNLRGSLIKVELARESLRVEGEGDIRLNVSVLLKDLTQPLYVGKPFLKLFSDLYRRCCRSCGLWQQAVLERCIGRKQADARSFERHEPHEQSGPRRRRRRNSAPDHICCRSPRSGAAAWSAQRRLSAAGAAGSDSLSDIKRSRDTGW